MATRTIDINIQGDSSDAQDAIADARRQLDDLARERLRNIDLTIDVNAGNVDAQIDRARRRLADLEADINVDIDGDSPGRNFIGGFNRGVLQGLPSVFSSLSALGSAGGPVGLAIAAGIIGSILIALTAIAPITSAVIIAGFGAGAVAAVAGIGIAIASQFDSVTATAQTFGDTISGVMQRAAGSFEGPLVGALQRFTVLAVQLEPQLTRIFNAIAPLIQPFADALADMVLNSMPGFVAMVETFAPLVAQLAPLFADLGTAVSDVMLEFSKSQEAQDAFVIMGTAILMGTAMLIRGLGDFLVWSAGFADTLAHHYRDLSRAATAWQAGLSLALSLASSATATASALISGAFAQAGAATDRARATMSAAIGGARAAISGGVAGIVGAVSSGFAIVSGLAAGLPNRLVSPLLSLPGRFRAAGAAAIEALTSGISSRVQGAIDTVSRLASKLASFLPGSPVKTGPLRVLNNGYAGGQIVRMLTDGIEREGALPEAALAAALPNPTVTTAGSASATPAQVVIQTAPGASALDDMFMDWLRSMIAVRGGSVQTVLGRV